MTIGDWLDGRCPPPPPALSARVREMLGPGATADVREAPRRFEDAAVRVLTELLRTDCTTRQSALDLLVADALMTYAFEAAADDPSTLGDRAREATRRVAAATARTGR